MVREIPETAKQDTVADKLQISIPNIYENPGRDTSKQQSATVKESMALLDRMITTDSGNALAMQTKGRDKVPSELDKLLMQKEREETARRQLDELEALTKKFLKKQETPQVNDKERQSVQDNLAKRLKERYKDTWELLPKEHRESILKLQNAVTSGDLKHLKEWAKGLDSEVAEKMAKVVDKNLQDAGSKVHVKSADGRSLVYGNGSAEGVLIGNDGKARVVAMKAEEVNNTARILDGETPFKSVTTLAKELADSAVRNIKKQELNKQK